MVINPITSQKSEFQLSTIANKNVQQTPFKDLLSEAVNNLNYTDAISNKDNIELLTNGNTALHTIMINAEKADIALQYTLQIRNKLLDAYNEIMRMQI